MKRVLVAVPDLLFGVQVANAVRAAGGEALTIRHAEEAFGALATIPDALPDAVVVDLSARIDPRELIETAAALGIPVFAFGPHLDNAALPSARAAGAERVVANSGLARALPAWLAARLPQAGAGTVVAPMPFPEDDLQP